MNTSSLPYIASHAATPTAIPSTPSMGPSTLRAAFWCGLIVGETGAGLRVDEGAGRPPEVGMATNPVDAAALVDGTALETDALADCGEGSVDRAEPLGAQE